MLGLTVTRLGYSQVTFIHEALDFLFMFSEQACVCAEKSDANRLRVCVHNLLLGMNTTVNPIY